MPITPVIDHAVINVDEELDQAQCLFQRMGFQLSTRGHHSMGSSNHLAIFADNYLELLGYEPARQTDARGLWNVAPGLAGLVWKTRDAHAVWRHLQQCQLDGEPPTRFFRPVILPDGSQTEARFCISRIRASAVEYGFSFFCEHQTPQAVWQPAWQVHPNSVQALSAFVIASPQPEQTLALYRQLFGTEARAEENGGYVLDSGTCCLRIITHQQASLEFALPPVAAQAPAKMVALCFQVASLEQLRRCLSQGDIQWREQGHQVLVMQQQAQWLAMRFAEKA
ncbi:VOC family protein [Kosakonia oryzae]|uniref:Glyoxalase-like domain-containing protein n=1 Tax=Kosakonia oryzae TaxID=497725 RepID=A0AA94KP16_9ENTR|nr:VOC family protein [Kosakonia oryzae]ANI83421.1 VOC family protein [Kosakonia oryzae]UDJ80541.1 VOC family protein [Kosakonia oryzae]SFB98849.1 Glyoxalase-like domain-containing protein [Kosakonia oryzae]